tara:strand:- start:66 stop:395 length:330 start_codon:yes stop_codon:yes gene_type:complete
MTTETKVAEAKLEDKYKAADYSCEVLLENTTQEKSKDRSFPTDAFNVTYIVNGETRLDVTRSYKMVNIFDYYYDRFGKGSVQKIDYGHGTIKPSQFGYKKAPDKKKRRK